MPKLPDKIQKLPTIEAIYQHYENKQPSPHRMHLGASLIGSECNRYLWYKFRWCDSPQIEGRVYRLFDRGDVEEPRIIKDLRAVGVKVYDVDPDTGKQWSFSAVGGHFGLSLDGVGQGFRESKKWHNLEFKTANNKSFEDLKKKGVQQAQPKHYAQMQVGMHLADLERSYYIAVNKDNEELYGERIHYDKNEGERLVNKAERVITSDKPLTGISDKPTFYKCKWCEMQDICHYDSVPEVNCRTCAHSTPVTDGGYQEWRCEKFDEILGDKTQRAGCSHHLFNPYLIPYAEFVAAELHFVEYQKEDGSTFYNVIEGQEAKACYTSQELRAIVGGKVPQPEQVDEIRDKFQGEICATK